MVRASKRRTIAVCFACVLVASLSFPVAGGSLLQSENGDESSVTATVDCEERSVRVSAPSTAQYRIQVAVVNVTPTGTSTAQSSTGPHSGNETVTFDEAGLVHVFVTNSSTGEVVASAVTDCSEGATATETDETTNDTETPAVPGVESVVVDCNESVVRVVASPDVRYDVSVAVVRVSPTSQAVTSVTTGPHSGNATVQFSELENATQSVDANATVYAFVSTDTERTPTVSTVTQCPGTNATTPQASKTGS